MDNPEEIDLGDDEDEDEGAIGGALAGAEKEPLDKDPMFAPL